MAKISIDLKTGDVKKSKDVIVGIDLGTTNSLVAYLDNGMPTTVKDQNGKNVLMPSVIHFPVDGAPQVGVLAKDKLETHPARTIYSVKRLMGKSYQDLMQKAAFFAYNILETEEDQLVKIEIDNTFHSPINLSSLILKALKKRVETALDIPVTKAVITVPAYYNDTQRQATRDAGKLAGLDVLRIINEPTAASLAYGLGKDASIDQKIAVYDLGGGTFDISILYIQEGIFEVLATHGDTFLGGDDFDKAIMDYWLKELEWTPAVLTKNKSLLQQFRLKAEEAKKALTNSSNFLDSIEGHAVQISLEQFNLLIEPLVGKSLESCRQALSDSKLQVQDIDAVVMVGGSTRVPLVQERVEEFFNRPLHNDMDPDQVVAMGAAIQADILAGNQKDLLLLDITPLSLGIETMGRLMDVIIPRNSTVPIKQARQYTTSVDGQVNLKVSVFQGERDLVEDNRKLGEFILKGIPAMPAGIPKIEIRFLIDADGILRVQAQELRSGVEQEIEVRSQFSLPQEEMGRMLAESLKHAESDMKTRARTEAVNEAKVVLLATDKFLIQNKSILSSEETEQISSMAKALRDLAEGDGSKDAIQSKLEALNNYSRPIAERAMDFNISKAMKGKNL